MSTTSTPNYLLNIGMVRAYMVSINPDGADPITDADLCWFNCMWNAIRNSDMSTKDVARQYKEGIPSMHSLAALQRSLDDLFFEDDNDILDQADLSLRIELAKFVGNQVVVNELTKQRESNYE